MAKTGRPRGFDKDQATEQAMHLFWEHGYEATSLSQLKAAMGGLSPSSFFAAFGSKEELFRAVLDRYLATHGQVVAALRDPALPPREAVERALRGSARMQTGAAHPPGCLVVVSATTCAPENRHLRERLAEERAGNRAALRACVDRAVAAGELRPGTDATGLAAALDAVLTGLSTQARDGVPLPVLEAGIMATLGAWDAWTTGGASTERTSR